MSQKIIQRILADNMEKRRTKFIRSTGRHQAEVVDESGNVIDRAMGRQSVLAMKQRHGIKPEADPQVDWGHEQEKLPTGFEDEPKTELARLKSERDELKSKLDSALQRIASARSLLAPLGSQPVPSVLAIREALQILR